MIIVEGVKFFVYTLDLIWWSLGRLYIPGTSVNGQFLFIFASLLALGWKILQSKILPPVRVDNVEIKNNGKNEETYNKISRKRKAK